MRLTIDMPERVWGKLATIADNKGIDVATLVADTVEYLILPPEKVERPLNNLELLNRELNLARREGWRAPTRGKKK